MHDKYFEMVSDVINLQCAESLEYLQEGLTAAAATR